MTSLGLTVVLLASSGGAASQVSAVALDHVVLGISDLGKGRKVFEDSAGVEPVIGGVHPGMGTWNALLSIGDHIYLEIIAPNPEASTLDPMFGGLVELDTLTPVLWLARTADADATVASLREAGYEVGDPQPGSREMPDGRVLRWRTFALTSPPSAVVPFFIEWAEDSPHPATTSPEGCRLAGIELQDPNPEDLRKLLDILGLEIDVAEAEKPSLRLAVDCPKGTLHFP